MAVGRPIPAPIKARILELHAQGITALHIAIRFNLSHNGVKSVIARARKQAAGV